MTAQAGNSPSDDPSTDEGVAVTRAVVHAWVRAVERRDVDALLATLAPDCSYRNVPEPAAVGHEAIRELFERVLSRSDRVVFDIVSESYEPGRAWLERIDRFWIDGTEHALACNGVLVVDRTRALITEVRDYLDLTGWRQQMVDAGL